MDVVLKTGHQESWREKGANCFKNSVLLLLIGNTFKKLIKYIIMMIVNIL